MLAESPSSPPKSPTPSSAPKSPLLAEGGLDTYSHQSKSPTSATSKLIKAATDNDLTEVGSLISLGAQINARVRGTTALHESAKAGHIEIVQELITRRAEVNAINRSGCTALHFATLCKDKTKAVEILKFLVDSGSQVNCTSERMDTPLHYAAYCQTVTGSEEVVEILLCKRAMVNARNRNAESPLINAALNNNASAAKILLQHNADMGQRTSMEKTALDIAMERGCEEVIQLLEKMKDPLVQLSDTTALMRTALSQMQTVDMLSGQLRQQTLLTEAYEFVAAAAVAELEVSARARLASQALSVMVPADIVSRDPSCLAPAQVPLSPAQLIQALVSLLLISRTPSGGALLHKAGVFEAMPNVEEQVRRLNIGHKELRELKSSLSKAQVELLEMSAERSCSSTPSSIYDQCTHCIAPSTPSTTTTTRRRSASPDKTSQKSEFFSEGTIQLSETPSSSCDPAEVGHWTRRHTGSHTGSKNRCFLPMVSGSSPRKGSPALRRGSSAECRSLTSNRSSLPGSLPLIADEWRGNVDEEQQTVFNEQDAGTASDCSVEPQADISSSPGTTRSELGSSRGGSCANNRSSWVRRLSDNVEGGSSQLLAKAGGILPSSSPTEMKKAGFDTIPREDAEAEARENRSGAELIRKYREQAAKRGRESRMCLVS